MLEIACLEAAIPVGGRCMSKNEAAMVNRIAGGRYGISSPIVAATDDGWCGFSLGARVKLFILVRRVRSALPSPGVYPVLSAPVVGDGRLITQYESLKLRAAGVPCSTSWWLIPDGEGGAVQRGDGSAGVVLRVRGSVIPDGCCCWACAAVCPRRSGGVL